MAALQEVELGFVEKPEDPSLLKDPFFPSKVGGKPAWLDLRALPSPEKLACISCRKPSVFLLQIYAPLGHLNPQAFHRSVFIFMCRDPSCHQNVGRKAFKVFRLQLPNTNICESEKNQGVTTEETADNHDPEGQEEASAGAIQEEAATLPETSAQACSILCDEVKLKPSPPVTPQVTPSLCVVCGCLGPKKCGKCKRANYCSREHQVHDWKAGHKLYCSDFAAGKLDQDSDTKYVPSAGVLLPEFEIVTEAEPEHPVVEEEERSESERMEDYYKFVKSGKYKEITVDDKAENVVEKAKSDLTSDKYFKAFKKRVAMEPEQVYNHSSITYFSRAVFALAGV